MSLIRYRQLPMTTLQDQINRMFDEFDQQFFGEGENLASGTFSPAMDVKEDADVYTVQLEVPGLKQEQLQLSLQDSMLTVRGTKDHKRQSGMGEYRRVERSYGTFARSVTLPRPVDGTQVGANLQDGVLTITLPKLEAAKPRQITIGTNVQPATSGTGQTVTVEAQPQEAQAQENTQTGTQPTGEPEASPS